MNYPLLILMLCLAAAALRTGEAADELWSARPLTEDKLFT